MTNNAPTRRSSLADQSIKFAKYWQSVLRFGLPFVVLYRGSSYLAFRIAARNGGLRYPWSLERVLTDVALALLVSFFWWAFMRELAAAKRKAQGNKG
jgi:hypothetical protein